MQSIVSLSNSECSGPVVGAVLERWRVSGFMALTLRSIGPHFQFAGFGVLWPAFSGVVRLAASP